MYIDLNLTLANMVKNKPKETLLLIYLLYDNLNCKDRDEVDRDIYSFLSETEIEDTEIFDQGEMN